MRLLTSKYKTYEGARKRADLENGYAASEFEAGYKAALYRYTVIEKEGAYRVARHVKDK